MDSLALALLQMGEDTSAVEAEIVKAKARLARLRAEKAQRLMEEARARKQPTVAERTSAAVLAAKAARAALPSNVVAAVAPPPRSSERTAAMRRLREHCCC